MIIVGDLITTEAQTIYVRNSIPGVRLTSLVSYSETTIGETLTNFFTKNFRYSLNGGVTWEDWQELNDNNLLSLSINFYDELTLEYSYLPTGTSTSGLVFISNQLTVVQTPLQEGEKFKGSVFEKFFSSDDSNVTNWYLNVTEKIFNEDILARYISRYNDQNSPDDFILYWKSIAKFLAFYVILARKTSQFYSQTDFLKEYLEGRGLVTSQNDTLEELTFLMSTYLYQIRNRGTSLIYEKVVPDRSFEPSSTVNGELLRLVEYDDRDEFIFNLYRTEHLGWNLGNSSPLYRGMSLNENANKIYETNSSITDLSRWPLLGNVTKQTINSIDNFILSGNSGIGSINNTTIAYSQGLGLNNLGSEFIKVSSALDYELDFFIKKDAGTNLSIGLDGYDSNGSLILHTSAIDGTTTSDFIVNTGLSRSDVYLHIKCIVYNSKKIFNSKEYLNINSGNNLIFNPDTSSIIPRIIFSGSGNAYIQKITFLPLATQYSRGFIQTQNFISCWLKDNRRKYDYIDLEPISTYSFQQKQKLQITPIVELENYIKKFLIPYNSTIKLTNISTVTPLVTHRRIFTDEFTEQFT